MNLQRIKCFFGIHDWPKLICFSYLCGFDIAECKRRGCNGKDYMDGY